MDLALRLRGGSILDLWGEIVRALGTERVDLVDLDEASPVLRFTVAGEGRLLYARSEEAEREFELAAVREMIGPRGAGGAVIDDVSKRLGAIEALRSASLRVEPGSVTALVGANGSGKTTLLRIVAGVLEPDSGRALVAGSAPGRGEAAYVPTGDRGLHWRLTGRQNLEFFARIGGVPAPEVAGRVAGVAAGLGAEALLDRRVGACSTGERRRLALARGFVSGAPVVLLDEPFEDLDEEGCRAVARLARGWAEAGGAVIYAAPVESGGPAPDERARLEAGRVSATARAAGSPSPASGDGVRTSLGAAMAAFLRRDARVALSYRLPFVLDTLSAAFTVVTFLFVSRVVRPASVPGGYLAFVMVGLALSAFLQAGMSVIAGNVRQEQVQGTLEATVASGIPLPALAGGMAVYPLVSAAVRAAVFVALAAGIGARAPGANWGLAVLATALGSVSFAGLGLVGAALVLVVRQAAAATAWLVSVLGLAAGTLFPPSLLPGWARGVAALSPFTRALATVRGAVLQGAGWSGSAGDLAALTALALASAAAGLAALWGGLRWARRRGGLAQY